MPSDRWRSHQPWLKCVLIIISHGLSSSGRLEAIVASGRCRDGHTGVLEDPEAGP